MNLTPDTLKNRERLRKMGDLESLRALARTLYQEKNLEDFLHFVGKNVSVVWRTAGAVFDKQAAELSLFDCADWENQTVVNVVRFRSGEIMAELAGRCQYDRFVRVERLKENV